MLTKQRAFLKQQFVVGKINILTTARRLGYKGKTLAKGIRHVRGLLMQMGITML